LLVQGSIFNEEVSPSHRNEPTIDQYEINSEQNDSGQSITFDLKSVEKNENNVQETLLGKTNNAHILCLLFV